MYKHFFKGPMEIFKKIDAHHLKLGCSLKEFEGGVHLPISYSDRLSEEINLLFHGCGLFDLKACWLIALKGEDAGSFLQGLVTSDVLKLKIGQIQSSLICDNKGKILHHLKILRSNEKEWIVICDPGSGRSVGTILDNFHVRENLELRLLNNEEMLRVDLIGPESEKILREIGYSLKRFQWNFEDDKIFSVNFNLGKTSRFINLVHANVLQNFVMQVIKRDNVGFVSQKSFDELRISEGIPRIGVDYNIGNLPQEVGLADHISFKKGCYVGQETHSRMFYRGHANWVSVWLQIPKNINTFVGKTLYHNSKEVGKISSLGSFAQNGCFIGIAMIKNEVAKDEIKLSLKNNSAPVIKQKSLPFIIKKQIEA